MNTSVDDIEPLIISPSTGRAGGLATIMFGTIAGIDNLGNGLAIAALLFTGPLATGYGFGVGAVLLSGIILAVVVGLRSNQPNAVAVVQETSIAILAAAVATAAAHMTGPAEVKVATALAILGTSTIFAGALFFAVGHFRLGGLARFLPYPVIAGFLAGSGWLLLVGGMSMVTGEHHEVDMIARLAEPLVLAKVVPAFAFALLMVVVLRRVSHPMAAPGLLVLAGACFYLVLLGMGIHTEQARAWGWLSELPAGGGIAFPTLDMMLLVDWRQVLLVSPTTISAAALSMIGVLLNTSGLELATGKELDANAELRATGLANLLAGVVGGLSGFVALGNTLLAEKMGVRGRSAGLANAGVLALGLVFAQPLIASMPVFLTSGLVIFLGLELLYEWAIESRHRLPKEEWSIVLIILVVIAVVGFLEGLGAGLLVSVAMFVYSYSRLAVIRLSASGSEMRSSVDRSPAAMAILSHHGAAIEAVHLQGYLFFGTADRIVEHVRQRIGTPNLSKLRFLILDFRHVGGCDSAATACFVKVRNIAELDGVRVLFSQVSPEIERLLRQAGLEFSENGPLSVTPDMDHALEYCEACLLAETYNGADAEDVLHYLEAVLGPNPRLAEMVEAMEVLHLDAGTPLIRSGDKADDVFILARGRVKVQVTLPDGRVLRLRTMTSGAIVGEIALYLQQMRSADVIVEEVSTIFRLGAADLRRLESENGEVATLVHRLFATNLAEKLMLANRLIQLAHG